MPEPESQFADDEMWAVWSNAGGGCGDTWVELGAIVGHLNAPSDGPSTPYAFTASCTVAAGFLAYSYTSMEVPVSQWFTLQADAAGVPGGFDWYMYFNGVGPWGADSDVPSRDPSVGIEAGDENTSNANRVSGEVAFTEWQDNSGLWYGWRHSGNTSKRNNVWASVRNNPEIPACAVASSRKQPGDFLFYSHTGTPPSICWENEGEPFITDTLNGGLAELEVPSAPSFASLWHAPNELAPEKTPIEVGRLMKTFEAEYSSPSTEYSEVHTTRAAALTALKGLYPADSGRPELETWLSGDAVILQAHGNFVASHVSVPTGEDAPTGTMLSLVLDARTGSVMAVQLSSTGPSLSQYGKVVAHA